MGPWWGLGVDRGVDRRLGKSQGHVCIHSTRGEASLLVKQVLRTNVLFIIRRSSRMSWATRAALSAASINLRLIVHARRAQLTVAESCGS